MTDCCVKLRMQHDQGLWEGDSAGTSVCDPEGPERARESMKGPITLVIDVLLNYYHFFFFYGSILNYF